jgi:hypothetical protein
MDANKAEFLAGLATLCEKHGLIVKAVRLGPEGRQTGYASAMAPATEGEARDFVGDLARIDAIGPVEYRLDWRRQMEEENHRNLNWDG